MADLVPIGSANVGDEWGDGLTLASIESSATVSSSTPTTSVPWYSGLSSIISSVGNAAVGILKVQQGPVYDQYGRLVSVNGQPVSNSSSLSAVVGGMNITTLLLLGLGILLVIKLAK